MKESSSREITKYKQNALNVVYTPTNALFINLVKSFTFTLKCAIISRLHVSVFNDHHHGALSIPNWSYIYVKTLGKITSLYIYIYIYTHTHTHTHTVMWQHVCNADILPHHQNQQNCNNLKMAAIGRNILLFFATKHYHESILP
jgi:uncharacterized membrane protein YdjX (TVP38/TMEM64 family)